MYLEENHNWYHKCQGAAAFSRTFPPQRRCKCQFWFLAKAMTKRGKENSQRAMQEIEIQPRFPHRLYDDILLISQVSLFTQTDLMLRFDCQLLPCAALPAGALTSLRSPLPVTMGFRGVAAP